MEVPNTSPTRDRRRTAGRTFPCRRPPRHAGQPELSGRSNTTHVPEHLRHVPEHIRHNITNYVTVNDCANMVLACGVSPIMADDAAEVEDITSLCAGLNLNIGTLNSRTIPSMLLAGHTAHRLGRPVVLDPVGAGASHLRTETALRLLREVKPTVIRGNISEMRTLAVGSGTTKGVDADASDKITEETLDRAVAFVKSFAARTGAVIAVTGAIDIVADRPAGVLHPQRPPHDERRHRHRLSALGPDGGLLRRQPRQTLSVTA